MDDKQPMQSREIVVDLQVQMSAVGAARDFHIPHKCEAAY